MNTDTLVERVKLRFLEYEAVPSDEVIVEIIQTVSDRLKIRLETDELPDKAGSIVVDASIKALRLRGYEGSTSESAADGGSMSNSFIDDVLSAYGEDLAALYKTIHASGVKFFW